MKPKNIYTPITIIAMLTMPAAAAINFGDAAYDALLGRTSQWIAVSGGIATGIGFEAIGILAGHLAVLFYSRRDSRAVAAIAALVAYVSIGMYELWSIDMARFVPLLAGLVYLLAGLQHEATEEKEAETAVNQTKLEYQLEQARLDREAERERKARGQADKTAVQLARIEAKASMRANQSQHRASLEQIELAPERIECEDCGQSFGTVQALNAHGRWCKAKPEPAVHFNRNGVSK
jgi:hypothetical protein